LFELNIATNEARNLLFWINEIGFNDYSDRQVLEEIVRAVYKTFCAGVTTCRIHKIFGSKFDNEPIDEHFFDLLFVPFFYPAATQSSVGVNIEQLKEHLDKTEKDIYVSNLIRISKVPMEDLEIFMRQQTPQNWENLIRGYISIAAIIQYLAAYGLSEQEIVNLILV